ncbi:21 kDa seed protein-like [Lycium barbarum]|uniref:21 kDa seed protein-like n=1 Tax=Lycium barbarum TaxID=112863 RepID=UPI00293F4B9F|nr:21 kDa seed protein-like [Lycium barbarum]
MTGFSASIKSKAVTPKDNWRTIRENAVINIKFDLDTHSCANLTVWKIDNYPKPVEPYTTSTGAELGNPLDVNSWFQIWPLVSSMYKIVFCPEKFHCENVGVSGNSVGYWRLALQANPKAFVFKRDKRIGMEIV